MNEDRSEERECELVIEFFHYGNVESSYDAKTGLLRCLVLLGQIDDKWYDDHYYRGDSAFHDKPVRLEIYSKPDEESLERIRVDFMGGTGDPCGVVRVTAGLEPERFSFHGDGEDVETEPVYIDLFLSPDAFEAIRRQAAEAYDHRLIMRANMTLVGDALLAMNRDETMPFGLKPRELDISVFNGYGVRSFVISTTRSLNHLHGRVLAVKPRRAEGYGTEISILLTEARYEINVERGIFHSIACEGYVVKGVIGRGNHWAGAEVTVQLNEHEPNRSTELHKGQFFGEFSYHPALSEEGNSIPHFLFELRYVSEDARNLIIPLLSQQGASVVSLTVQVTSREEELLTTTGELRGKVRDYRFTVTQHLKKNA
jgi:hypothetical protein